MNKRKTGDVCWLSPMFVSGITVHVMITVVAGDRDGAEVGHGGTGCYHHGTAATATTATSARTIKTAPQPPTTRASACMMSYIPMQHEDYRSQKTPRKIITTVIVITHHSRYHGYH